MKLDLTKYFPNLIAFTRVNWISGSDELALGMFRIILGGLSLLYFILLGPDWLNYYGPNGLSGTGSANWIDFTLFHILNSMSSIWEYVLYYVACIVASLCLILGIGWKIPILWLWIANFTILSRNYAVGHAEVQVFAVVLWFSLFLPLNSSMRFVKFNVVSKLNGAPWAYRSLSLYISLIYLISIPARIILDPAWRDGSLVYFATQEILHSRWPGISLFAWGNGIFSKIGTYSTLSIESICPILLQFNRTRAWAAICLALLHTVLMIFLEGVAMFNLCMIVGLSLFFPWARIVPAVRAYINRT